MKITLKKIIKALVPYGIIYLKNGNIPPIPPIAPPEEMIPQYTMGGGGRYYTCIL
jgi:hypothetical protein